MGVDGVEMFVWEVEESERVGVFPLENTDATEIKQIIKLNKSACAEEKKCLIC